MSVWICVLVVFILAYFWRMRRLYRASFEMKGPIALPFIGNCLQFLGSTEDILQTTARMVETYGTPFRLWIGTRFLVGITNPEDFEIVLNNPNSLVKEELYEFFSALIGDSIFSLQDVSRWRQHRKSLAPTFNPKILESFIPIFEEQSLMLCEKLGKMAGNGVFDVYPLVAPCTLDFIFETAMGAKVNIQLGNEEYMHWVDDACAISYKRIFRIWSHFDFIFKWTQEGKRFKECIEGLRNFNEKIIRKKQAQYKQNQISVKRKAFLDYLIEASDHFTDKEIRDEVATFIVAGSHTTSGGSSFVLMMLGMHPEIQEKVFEEQQEIFENTERALTNEDLSRMKYLERVIKETLRLFPLSFIVGRTAMEDVKLRTCTLPKGSGCILGIYHAHRDPKLYKDPLQFNPDRFLPEEISKRHPYAWIPFSAGPRNCIGLRYAMIAMKVLLSTVVRRYKIYCHYGSVGEIRIRPDLLLKAVEGHQIALESRIL